MNTNSPFLWLAVLGALSGLLALYVFILMPTYTLQNPLPGETAQNTNNTTTSAPPGTITDPNATASRNGPNAYRVPAYSQRQQYAVLRRRSR